MGSNIVGSTKISYMTKDKVPVEYIYYDLKGKNRFPSCPSNDKESTIHPIQFNRCSVKLYATSTLPPISSKSFDNSTPSIRDRKSVV